VTRPQQLSTEKPLRQPKEACPIAIRTIGADELLNVLHSNRELPDDDVHKYQIMLPRWFESAGSRPIAPNQLPEPSPETGRSPAQLLCPPNLNYFNFLPIGIP
jgi:hypothetical protein